MGEGIELPGSFRPPPSNDAGAPRDNARVGIVLHLKHPQEARHGPGSAEDFADLLKPVSRAALAERRRRDFKPARALLADFADRHGLKLGRVRPMTRTARLEGSAAQIREAFGATLHRTSDQAGIARSGSLTLPDDLATWTRAVLNFSGRTARPVPASGGGAGGPGLWPSTVARLYGVPAAARADGQCIAVIAPGGAYRTEDLQAAARQAGIAPPSVSPPPDAGAFGQDSTADTELALDLQVLAGAAPGAKLVVYSCAQSNEGMLAALHSIIADKTNAPHVVSLSWSSAEDMWDSGLRATFDAALQDAIRLRIAVVVAAGDNLATGGIMGGRAHVYYPASSPYVLACGGTSPQLDRTRARIVAESVWNDTYSGTGGGISALYPVPSFQSQLALPPSVNPGAAAGRGVPDVAAAAWSKPGYALIVGDARTSEPGTSAATPLWAAILALANARRRSPLGFVNQLLYARPDLFRPITTGDNKDRNIGYVAGAPWNACTGLGVPKAAEIIAALAAAP